MPAPFAFATATEILFGRGQAAQAASRIAGMGKRVLLVQGGNPARAGPRTSEPRGEPERRCRP